MWKATYTAFLAEKKCRQVTESMKEGKVVLRVEYVSCTFSEMRRIWNHLLKE